MSYAICDPPLVEARLLRRYKRFLADVETADGETVTIHCPNSGAMLGVAPPGAAVAMAPAQGGGKLPFRLSLVHADACWIGVDTGWPNRLAEAAIRAGDLPAFDGYETIRREVRYGRRNSRIDLLLQGHGRPDCYVEVKNVHLRRTGDLAEFPDSVTARGAKHLAELADMARDGARAAMLFVVQRPDCRQLGLAADIDPDYAAAFAAAREAGVEAHAFAVRWTPAGVDFAHHVALRVQAD
ncbi:MAG: DNA/RNA nuclease SfsA [Pseudomonadota bacterium]